MNSTQGWRGGEVIDDDDIMVLNDGVYKV